MPENCERCGDGLPNVYEHMALHRCAACKATLCQGCLEDGCCGEAPGASWSDRLEWQGRDPRHAGLSVEEYMRLLRGDTE